MWNSLSSIIKGGFPVESAWELTQNTPLLERGPSSWSVDVNPPLLVAV